MLRCPSFVAVALGVVGATLSLRASARELDYRAVDGCPTRADVAARIDARAPDGRAARIDIRTSKHGYLGEVVVGEGDRHISRVIEARTCASVVEALALVIALDHEDPEAPAPSGTDDTQAPIAEPPTNAPPVRVAAPSFATRDRPEATTTPDSGLSYALLAAGRLTSFADGHLLFGSELGAEAVARGAPLRPSLRASLLLAKTVGWSSHGGVEPEFSVLGGVLDGCLGAPWWYTERLRLAGCSRTEVGSLTASAAGVDASAESRWWLATGAALRARLLAAKLGRAHVAIELSASLLAELIRDRFHFTGKTTIVADPWLWTGGLGVGVELR